MKCASYLHSLVSNYLFVLNARNRLAISSDSESDLSITQRSFRGGTAIELSENNFESLFACADNEQAVDNLKFRSEDLLTDRPHYYN